MHSNLGTVRARAESQDFRWLDERRISNLRFSCNPNPMRLRTKSTADPPVFTPTSEIRLTVQGIIIYSSKARDHRLFVRLPILIYEIMMPCKLRYHSLLRSLNVQGCRLPNRLWIPRHRKSSVPSSPPLSQPTAGRCINARTQVYSPRLVQGIFGSKFQPFATLPDRNECQLFPEIIPMLKLTIALAVQMTVLKFATTLI
jgi:hypothetical protein